MNEYRDKTRSKLISDIKKYLDADYPRTKGTSGRDGFATNTEPNRKGPISLQPHFVPHPVTHPCPN